MVVMNSNTRSRFDQRFAYQLFSKLWAGFAAIAVILRFVCWGGGVGLVLKHNGAGAVPAACDFCVCVTAGGRCVAGVVGAAI